MDPSQEDILGAAERLRHIVGQITIEEFRWQDSHYGRDSRFGRELLFLIANDEWTRSTSEIVDISRSDAVDTTIKIDVDIDQITHEAFRTRAKQLWLPLLVLPGPVGEQPAAAPQHGWRWWRTIAAKLGQPGQSVGDPDPFATLTVTGAKGELLAMLPNADVRHRISAAMAEIIVNMAVANWSGQDEERPTATRDQRLLLSAAIYRLLGSGHAESAGSRGHRSGTTAPRPTLARRPHHRGTGEWELSRSRPSWRR